MTVLFRYITKTILLATLLVLLVITGLTFFISVLTELRDIGIGDYSFMQAVIHSLLRLPYSIYGFFPMAMLLGATVGLSILANHREFLVMRVSGMSLKKMMVAIISITLLLVLMVMFIGEVLAPRTSLAAQLQKDTAQSGGQAVVTLSGVWMHEGNNFLHVDRMMTKNHLEGITRYEFDASHRLIATYYAKSLDYENHQWVLRDLVKTTFSNDKTVSQSFAKTTWNLTLNPSHLTMGYIEPEEMSLKNLYEFFRHSAQNGVQSAEFEFAFWKRVLQPLATVVMVLLALPFVLIASRAMTMGRRILFSVTAGFIFYMLNALLGQLCIVFQWPPLLAALLPIVLFGVIIYVMVAVIK